MAAVHWFGDPRVAKVSEADQPATLTPGEASKLTGIPTTTLKRLCEDRALPGVVRSDRSTYRLRADRLPTIEQVETLVDERVRRDVRRVRSAFTRVQIELEAVGNDIAELEDDPTSRMGVDLSAFDGSTISGHSTLRQALTRLTEAKWDLQVSAEMARELRPGYY